MTTESTKADDIALVIEEAIVSGELAPGTVLRQEHLSERFAVSRRRSARPCASCASPSASSRSSRTAGSVRGRSAGRTCARRSSCGPSLESLATEVAAEKITEADLAELVAAEKRFHRLTGELRSREPGVDRRRLTAEWVRGNHAFHDVIYRVAALPLVEQLAKSARRTSTLGSRRLGSGQRGDRRPLRGQRPAASWRSGRRSRREARRERGRWRASTSSPRSTCSR